jgi:polysaccharide pyruvyl transferase WcaK-like protein
MITLFCIRPKGFNVGNDAIFIAMQQFLYDAFKEVVNLISLPATSRYESQAKAGLSAKTIHEINQYGDGVIVGGGNLYENGELEISVNALETLQVPLMLFSLSHGRIYNRQGKLTARTDSMPNSVIKALNQKAHYSLVRDEATLSHLRSIGCTNAEVGGCPTIFLDRMAKRLPRLSSKDERGVFVSIRNPSLMNIPLPYQTSMYDDILRIIQLLKAKGYDRPRLLCHDYRDIPFAASFRDVDYIYTGDVYTYLALLRSSELSVSYRLHSVLPCLAFDRPAIKISYDERALSLMETIGFGEWNINLLQTSDLVADVADRCQRLADFHRIRSEAQVRWQELNGAMSQAFLSFASDVSKYRQGGLVRGGGCK